MDNSVKYIDTVTLADFGYPIQALWFYCSQNYLAFKSFDFQRTR